MLSLSYSPAKLILMSGVVFLISSQIYGQDSVRTFNKDLSVSYKKSASKFTIRREDSLATNVTKGKNNIENEPNNIDSTNKYFDETLIIGGLVIDHTQSKWGRDFVDLFNKSFNPPEQFNDYTVVIEEKPLPQFGTLILMKINGNYVYQKFIQPRYNNIKLNAQQAAGITLQYLANYQQIQKDLQGEDLKGTGIY